MGKGTKALCIVLAILLAVFGFYANYERSRANELGAELEALQAELDAERKRLKEAEEKLRKSDKQRASYYNYYATNTWGEVNNYDLCVDTGTLGVEGAVDLIASCVEIRDRYHARKKAGGLDE